MRRLTVILTAMAPLMLGACTDTWLGSSDSKPLPGKRISVLQHQQAITPSAEAQGETILLPAPSPLADWPQNGGYPSHAMHHVAVSADLGKAWSSDIGSGAGGGELFVTSPVSDGKTVYTFDAESRVSAFSAANGRELWSRLLTPDEEDDGHIGGGLAYDNGMVFATTGFAEVIALNAANGAEIWRKNVTSPMRSAPTVRGGRVFAITIDNTLYALAAKDGRQLWTHSGISETASLLGGASPAVDQGVVVVPYSSGELAALKVENGLQLWMDQLIKARRTDTVSSLAHIRGNPVIDRGRVFAIGHAGIMVSIDLRTGQRIWESNIGGQQTPWVAGDYVYFLSLDQELVAMSREDATVHWVTALPRYDDPEDRQGPIVWTGPLLVSNRLIVAGSSGEAVAVSPYSGKILGSEEMPDAVSVPPIVAGDTVFFLSDDAELTAYR